MSTNPTPEVLEAAELAVSEAVAAAERFGPRIGSIRFSDGTLNATIRITAGNWRGWCELVTQGISGHRRERFKKNYIRLANGTPPAKQQLMRLIADDAHVPTCVVRTDRAIRYPAILDPLELQARIREIETARR